MTSDKDEKPRLAPFKTISRGRRRLIIQPDSGGWLLADDRVMRMLELCDGKRTLDGISELVSKEFEVSAEIVRKDLEALIPIMKQSGFAEPVSQYRPPPITEYPLLGCLIHLTNACNLRCSYCYLSAGQRLDNELTTHEVLNLIDDVAALKGNFPGQQRLSLSGGEPLLREDLWEIVEHVKKKGFWLKMTTNGTLIDEGVARKIADNFDLVGVSLDGSKEDHEKLRGEGSYDRAIEGIRHLTKAGANTIIGSVGSSENIGRVLSLVDVAKKFGIKTIALGMLTMTGRAEGKDHLRPSDDDYIEMMRSFKKRVDEEGLDIKLVGEKFISVGRPSFRPHACLAGIATISINSNGSVYPCANAMIDEFKMGNLRETPLKDIWEKSKVATEWRESTLETIPECCSCIWKRYCGGSCRINAYCEHGTINAPDRYCRVYSTLLEDAFFEQRRRDP